MALLAFGSLSVKADTIKEVTQEIKAGSVLPLTQNVAQIWAGNLLGAQGCAYCGPESLDLSILAVLKAIGLEQSLADFNWCGLSNCIWANQQSLIAIDPNAGLGISPNSVNFGLVDVPEPSFWILSLGGLFALAVSRLFLCGRMAKNI